MSHLVAYFGNEPENMACALLSARTALYARTQRGGGTVGDGFGLGFVQGGDVLLRKRPRAEAAEVDLYGLVHDARADAFVGRVGLSQDRGPGQERTGDGNTPAEDADPFRFRSWLFGSVGDPRDADFDAIRERMLESTPAFLRRNIRGRSSSEHLFHLFLAFMHDAGILDQPTPSPPVVCGALKNSLAFVERLLAANGSPALRLALVATNGRCFVATGCGHPMRYLNVEGISDCPVCHQRSEAERNGRRIPHENLRALVVEANRDVASRPGWIEIPDRSALIAGPDRVPHITSL